MISVGNLHSGGSGKTPIVIEIAKRIPKNEIVILSRGYRGRLSSRGSWVTDIAKGALFFGDEAWMMKKALPPEVKIYIDKDRVRAIKKIEIEKPHATVILDDGFQHVKLHRAVNILVISARKNIEESFCLPLGEMREPWSAAQAADLILITTSGLETEKVEGWKNFFNRPIFE